MKKINSSKSLKKATAFGAHRFETWDAVVSKDEITLCEQWPNIVRKLFCIKLVQMFVYCLQSVISPYNVVKFEKLNISKNKTFSIKSSFLTLDVGALLHFKIFCHSRKKHCAFERASGPILIDIKRVHLKALLCQKNLKQTQIDLTSTENNESLFSLSYLVHVIFI